MAEKILEFLWNYWKKDRIVILILVFSLLVCLYTINSVDKKIDNCNAHWIEQYEVLSDKCGYDGLIVPILNYSLEVNIHDSKNINTNS